MESIQIKKPSKEVVENDLTSIIPRENLFNYKEYLNLTSRLHILDY